MVEEHPDLVARDDRVAVMPVRIHGVHAVGAVQVAAGAQVVQLRAFRIALAPRHPFVAVLDLLQEHDVGVDRVQREPDVVDADLRPQAHHALVDVVRGDAKLHGALGADAAGRSAK